MANKKTIGLLLGLGVLAGVSLAFAGGKKTTKGAPKLPEGDGQMPAIDPEKEEQEQKRIAAEVAPVINSTAAMNPTQIAEMIAAAILTGDPALIEAAANRAASQGYKYADSVRAVATDLRKVIPSGATRATVAQVADAAKSQPELMKSPLPTTEDAEPGGSPTPAEPEPSGSPTPEEPDAADEPPRAAPGFPAISDAIGAERLAAYLRSVPKGKEDRSQVKAYQTARGLKVDGLFGTKTAGDVLLLGAVPPADRVYWATDWMRDKREFRAALLAAADQRPDKAAALRAEAAKIK